MFSDSVVNNFTKRVYLVSPPYACGVAWLVNALQALNIRTTNSNFQPQWIEEGDVSRVSDQAASHLKWHMPIFHLKSEFRFPESAEVVWEHRMDFADHGNFPVILFVRDPRDAIYSLYRRSYEIECGLDGFLDRADTWPDHFPGLFQLPAFSTYAYFCAFWLSMGRHFPLLIVRYEDVKTKPIETLSSVLSFLGLERGFDAMHEACQSSSFDNAKNAMLRMSEETGISFATARSGRLNEWESVYTAAQLDKMGADCKSIAHLFGYKGDFLEYIHPTDIDETLNTFTTTNVKRLAKIWIADCSAERPYDPKEVVLSMGDLSLNDVEILHCGLILRALYYVRRIFTRLDSVPAKLAIACFIYLNLRYANHKPIYDTGMLSLKYIQQVAPEESLWLREYLC